VSSIVEELPALIGVIVGASTSYLIGAATDRAGWRRRQSTRWDETRAQAYAEYARAVKGVYVQSLRIANSRRLSPKPDTKDYVAALAELGRLADERTAKWELVLLLGDPETVSAGRVWHRRVWQIEPFARGERADAHEYAALLAEIDTDRARFYRAARRDLGIRSGDVPSGGPWEIDSRSYTAAQAAKPPNGQPD
jgi:hypothetical protein